MDWKQGLHPSEIKRVLKVFDFIPVEDILKVEVKYYSRYERRALVVDYIYKDKYARSEIIFKHRLEKFRRKYGIGYKETSDSISEFGRRYSQ